MEIREIVETIVREYKFYTEISDTEFRKKVKEWLKDFNEGNEREWEIVKIFKNSDENFEMYYSVFLKSGEGLEYVNF